MAPGYKRSTGGWPEHRLGTRVQAIQLSPYRAGLAEPALQRFQAVAALPTCCCPLWLSPRGESVDPGTFSEFFPAEPGILCRVTRRTVGESRPACRATTGRPGERRSETRELDRQRPGKLREGEPASQLAMADRRVVKLRPVPQEPCRRREEPARAQGALRPGCPRGRSERRSNRCDCVLRGDRWESKAQSFRSDPWAAVRRARLDPMQPVPDSGDGNPPGF